MLRHIVLLSVISFFLSLVWEYVQCMLFFTHGSLRPTHTAMIVATLGDVGITWILYGAVALWRKNWFWSLERWRASDVAILLVLAISVASLIEIRAISTGRWGYTPNNPLVPGTSISIIPILQLAILVPASFWITRYLMKPRW